MRCQNGHFRWWYTELYKSERRVYWGEKNCSCLTEGIDNGFEPVGDDEQFTGLLDKNGREIYEGDVVKILATKDYQHGKDNKIGTILFQDRWASFSVWFDDIDEGESMGNFISSVHNDIEIIGDIYSNPELIK